MKFRKVDSRILDTLMYYDKASTKAGCDHITPDIRLSRHARSSGCTWGNGGMAWRIVLTMGTNEKDRQHVIIHECAHAMRGSRGHDVAFYHNMFWLARAMKFDVEYCKSREGRYKPRLLNRAVRSGRVK